MKGGEQSNKLECRVKQVSEARGVVKSVVGQSRKGRARQGEVQVVRKM